MIFLEHLISLSWPFVCGALQQFVASFYWFKWKLFVIFISWIISYVHFTYFKKIYRLQSGNAYNYIPLAILMCEIFWSIAIVFSFCEFGERVSKGFEKSCDTIKQLDWYSYPYEMQRLLPMVMLIVNKPVSVRIYGNISGTRGTFREVIHIKRDTFISIFLVQQFLSVF